MTPHWIEIPLGVTKDELAKGLEGLASSLRADMGAEALHAIVVRRNPKTGATGIILRMETREEMARRANSATGFAPPVDAPDD